jgi:hypothetical protein
MQWGYVRIWPEAVDCVECDLAKLFAADLLRGLLFIIEIACLADAGGRKTQGLHLVFAQG